MRTRSGFVANSSSSCFVLLKKGLTEDQLAKIRDHVRAAKALGVATDDAPWELTETDDSVTGETLMDNFDMEAFLRAIGLRVRTADEAAEAEDPEAEDPEAEDAKPMEPGVAYFTKGIGPKAMGRGLSSMFDWMEETAMRQRKWAAERSPKERARIRSKVRRLEARKERLAKVGDFDAAAAARDEVTKLMPWRVFDVSRLYETDPSLSPKDKAKVKALLDEMGKAEEAGDPKRAGDCQREAWRIQGLLEHMPKWMKPRMRRKG